jgi:hypothetical protein
MHYFMFLGLVLSKNGARCLIQIREVLLTFKSFLLMEIQYYLSLS